MIAAALSGRRYHFLRKEGKLRLRTEEPAGDLLDQLVARRLAAGWVAGVYEPEVSAFGGPGGMAVAHQLFCADSPAALAETGRPRSKERCILLISAMNRSAGLDPFEIGDVWARIADLRPEVSRPEAARLGVAVTAMRRLMSVDAGQWHADEPGWAGRVAAFEEAGRQLARLAADGELARGLRAVLAHHAIFAFNRAGSPGRRAGRSCLARPARRLRRSRAGRRAGRPGRTRHPCPQQTETTMTRTADPAELRHSMVTALTESGHLRTPAIIDAFREVERHRFIPDADLQAAYADDAVPIKHDDDSEMISCISAPSIVATQLEQLGVQAGHKILEAGAATGLQRRAPRRGLSARTVTCGPSTSIRIW